MLRLGLPRIDHRKSSHVSRLALLQDSYFLGTGAVTLCRKSEVCNADLETRSVQKKGKGPAAMWRLEQFSADHDESNAEVDNQTGDVHQRRDEGCRRRGGVESKAPQNQGEYRSDEGPPQHDANQREADSQSYQ